MALFALLCFSVVFAAVISDHSHVLADPDTLWHVTLGKGVVQDGWPHGVETASYTFQGQPFLEVEWLSDVIYYAGYAAAGWLGVITIAAAMAGFLAVILFLALADHVKPLYAATASILLCFATYPEFIARPHLISYVMLVFWTWRLFRRAGRDEAPEFLLLPLLSLWINLHPSYALAGVIASFAFLDVAWRNFRTKPGLVGRWGLFLLLCPLFLLLNPYGTRPLWVTLGVATHNATMKDIEEWQPFTLGNWPFTDIYFFAVPVLLLVIRPILPAVRAGFGLFSLYLFMKHLRFAFAYTLLAPVVLAQAIVAQVPALSAKAWRAAEPDDVERAAARGFAWFAGLLLVVPVAAIAIANARAPRPPPEFYVQDAIDFAKTHQLTGHVLNDYGFGGALIFNGVPTFVDGRSDQLFLGQFWADLKASIRPDGKAAFDKILASQNIRWTLLKPDDLRNLFLASEGWQKAYEDKYATIYTPPQ
ncbi:MAG: hypothetical protein KGO53_00910 [Alphaproteobacteria bacterium]|nr:hypothetical protein [Alphaproteobacteria bacterium]